MAAEPSQRSSSGGAGFCEHSGISIPECSCSACTRAIIREHGTAAAERQLSRADNKQKEDTSAPPR